MTYSMKQQISSPGIPMSKGVSSSTDARTDIMSDTFGRHFSDISRARVATSFNASFNVKTSAMTSAVNSPKLQSRLVNGYEKVA